MSVDVVVANNVHHGSYEAEIVSTAGAQPCGSFTIQSAPLTSRPQ